MWNNLSRYIDFNSANSINQLANGCKVEANILSAVQVKMSVELLCCNSYSALRVRLVASVEIILNIIIADCIYLLVVKLHIGVAIDRLELYFLSLLVNACNYYDIASVAFINSVNQNVSVALERLVDSRIDSK